MAAHQSLSLLLSPSPQVADTGLTVVHEPKNGEPIVDIILIHGLQGHPFNTWAAEHDSKNSTVLNKLSSKARGLFFKKSASETSSATDKSRVFWPRDLLPDDCPKARISVFGYNTVVAKHQLAGPANKNSVFAHSRDLVNELCRHRPPGRPTIFVTHSLGGILIKEALAACSTSNDVDVRDILESTAGIVFIGTPHRGSSAAGIGEVARKAASVLLMDTNALILDSLALKNSDLVRCQEIFSALWHKHNFAVKTFQEGLPLKLPIKIGQSKMTKVVPDESSCLGDVRERAETLSGDHRSICRFNTKDDPNYKKVANDLINQYSAFLPNHQTRQKNSRHNHRFSEARVSLRRDPFNPTGSPNHQEKLDLLKYDEMFLRQVSISTPAKDTCQWLLQNADDFQTWITRTNIVEHFGLLQITGKPGSGKSTLMKESLETIRSRHHPDSGTCIASHFFSRRGSPIEHSAQGMFRSILYQICVAHPVCLDSFTNQEIQFLAPSDSRHPPGAADDEFRALSQILERIMQSAFAPKATFILVDAIDECDLHEGSRVGYFLAGLARDAVSAGTWLNICITRREYPSITVPSLGIRMENHNSPDIRQYVHRRLELADVSAHDSAQIEYTITLGSNSIFLWAVLATDRVLRDFENGINTPQILRRTRTLPKALEDLFTEVLKDISPEDLEVTLRLFQWAVLATDRLRIREWHHILAFIREKPPISLEEWATSEFYTETDVQLERQIRSLSKGLIEIYTGNIESEVSEDAVDDIASHVPGAGSLDSNTGDGRFVQAIHESVGDFFLSNRANHLFGKPESYDFVFEGHQVIMNTCLVYIGIKEFDALVAARRSANRKLRRQLRRRASATSFMSSASTHSNWNQTEFDDLVASRRTAKKTLGSEASSASFTSSASSHSQNPENIEMPNSKLIDIPTGIQPRLVLRQISGLWNLAPSISDPTEEEERAIQTLSALQPTTTQEACSSPMPEPAPSLSIPPHRPTSSFRIRDAVDSITGSMLVRVKSISHGNQSGSELHEFEPNLVDIPRQELHLYAGSRASNLRVLYSNRTILAPKGTRKVRKSRSWPKFQDGTASTPRRRMSTSQLETRGPHESSCIVLREKDPSGLPLRSCAFDGYKWHAFKFSGTDYCWHLTESRNEARKQTLKLAEAGSKDATLAYVRPTGVFNSQQISGLERWISPSEMVIYKQPQKATSARHSGLTEEIILSTGLIALIDNRIGELLDHSKTDLQIQGPQYHPETSKKGFLDVRASLVRSWWHLNSMAEPWRGKSTPTSPKNSDDDEDDKNLDSEDSTSTSEYSVKTRVLGGYTALASYALNRIERHANLAQINQVSTPHHPQQLKAAWHRWEILKGQQSSRGRRL